MLSAIFFHFFFACFGWSDFRGCFVDIIPIFLGIFLTSQKTRVSYSAKMNFIPWASSQIPFWHVSFGCLFLTTSLVICHSLICLRLRKSDHIKSTNLLYEINSWSKHAIKTLFAHMLSPPFWCGIPTPNTIWPSDHIGSSLIWLPFVNQEIGIPSVQSDVESRCDISISHEVHSTSFVSPVAHVNGVYVLNT